MENVRARAISINIGQKLERAEPDWPVAVGLIPPAAACFQGRASAWARLTRPGTADTAGVVAESVQVVSGLAGVGKTQLAGAYARELLRAKAVDVLIWASAATRASIISSYAQAAWAIGLGYGDDPEGSCERLLGWLATTDRPWSIFLDDLADAEAIRDLWPPTHNPGGRTVVTTRRRDATLLAGRELAGLDVFTSLEASTYLAERLPAALADDTAGVASDLGGLPLALSHAAAYMLDRDLTCSDYRRRFADRRLAQLVPDPGTLFDASARTVATTWALSIEQANRFAPAGLAAPMLELASMLDPSGIPVNVLVSGSARAFLAEHLGDPLPSAHDDGTVWDALSNLHRLNLITITGSIVRVHALVQRAVRDSMPKASAGQVIRAAADAILESWPNVERDRALTASLRENSVVLTERSEGDALWASRAVPPLLLRTVRSLGEAGLVTAAVTAAAQMLQQAADRLGTDHEDTLVARGALLRWRGEAGDAIGAAAASQLLLDDMLNVFGPQHPHTLTTRRDLAEWRGEAGDAAGAVGILESLLNDMLSVFGATHPLTLATRGDLAKWRYEAGNPAGAVEISESLLNDMLSEFGPEHPNTLTTRCYLAKYRGEAGHPAEAVALLTRLVGDMVRVLGPDHPHTLVAQRDLARWRGEAGDPAGAAAAFEQLLVARLSVLDADHPRTLAARLSLAKWRGEAGDPAGAVSVLEPLLDDMVRVLGAEHPFALTTRRSLARWHGESGDAAGAVGLLATLLEDMTRALGADHRHSLTTRRIMAKFRGKADSATAAIVELEPLLDDMVRVLGQDHPHTLATRGDLANWRGEAGDAGRAAAALAELLLDMVRVLGSDHPYTLRVQANLARWR